MDKDGKIRDISSHIQDLKPDHLNFDTITKLQNANLTRKLYISGMLSQGGKGWVLLHTQGRGGGRTRTFTSKTVELVL